MSLFAKLWTDILGDPKLLRAARLGSRQLHLLPWLIVFAKKAEDDGRLTVNGDPADPVDIAHGIPCVTPKQVAAAIDELTAIGVLTRDAAGVAQFAAWERRSGHKPSDSPSAIGERVAKHRAKKRAEKRAEENTDETHGNALQGVTGNATEKEQEKEIEKEQDQQQPVGGGQPQSLSRDLSAIQAYARELTTYANAARDRRWGEQIHRLNIVSAMNLAEDLVAAAVPLEFAKAVIDSVTDTLKADDPYSTVEYFRRPMTTALKKRAEGGGLTVSGTANTPGDRSYDEATRAFEAFNAAGGLRIAS